MRQPQSTGYDITGSRFALAGLRGRSGGPDYFEQVLRLPTPRGLPDHPRADRAARPAPVSVALRPPGAARIEQQSVRYAARSQPLDWHFDRHDHMSTARPSTDLTPTAQALRPTPPLLRSFPGVCGWGPATPELDADLVAVEVLNLARPQGRRSRLSLADGTAVRRHPGRSGHAPDNA